jgi:abortive infection bacteriophage resistance protein
VSKPAISCQQQLDLLKSRGLIVPDEPFALHCLSHHNYYRLSPYRFPFAVPGNPDQFLPGTTFTQLWDLFVFDDGLRRLVMEICTRVEISVRSRWAYETGHRVGPLGYVDNRHFRNPLVHARTLLKLHDEMERSREDFIQHHRSTLSMPWPPAWVMVEVASFGNISKLLSGIRSSSLRQAVADTYGMDEQTFCSLTHYLSVLRNTAAHHARLWNRRFVLKFKLPRKKPPHLRPNFHHDLSLPKGESRIYNALILLLHLSQVIAPQNDWPSRLLGHVNSLNPALLPQMGFPPDWRTRPLWQAHP